LANLANIRVQIGATESSALDLFADSPPVSPPATLWNDTSWNILRGIWNLSAAVSADTICVG